MWRLPRPLLSHVLAVQAAGLCVALVSLFRFSFHSSDLRLFLLLTASGILSAEAIRRLGEPSGTFQDLATAWTLPMAFLLPPLYVVVAVAALRAHANFRIRRGVPHRVIFSICSVSFAHVMVGVLFRASTTDGLHTQSWAPPNLQVPAVALGLGILCAVISDVLVIAAVHLATPGGSMIRRILSGEDRLLDAVELTTGIIVTVLAVVNPLLVLVAVPPVLILQRSLMHEQLRSQARIDEKTGLLNAGTWNREAEREIIAAGRRQSSVAVLLIDLDHFKLVNDQHGHLFGDQVLRAVAAALRDQVRRYDLAGRFGGEEFVLMLPDAGPDRARRVAERLHQQVGSLAVATESNDLVRVTVSVGVALLRVDGHDVTELLAAADAALYRAKSMGRNRVCLATEFG